jgi:hypothetical protein
MEDYFRNLNSLDPLFHAIVLSKVTEIRTREGLDKFTVEDLSEFDELEILREYSVRLFKEHRTLRTVFLENMVITGRTVGHKYHLN